MGNMCLKQTLSRTFIQIHLPSKYHPEYILFLLYAADPRTCLLFYEFTQTDYREVFSKKVPGGFPAHLYYPLKHLQELLTSEAAERNS
ncbi:hypothetical protein NPIL_220821 [Nephila pilipes]|uniref:Uncharacterized protein n=1 Tax=Nephila pilipes TaxID=299642 RepID=A0A8X6NJK0_NEPPI|nr:hypothetical protein NPIL_220821 [Nephila pilipes]